MTTFSRPLATSQLLREATPEAAFRMMTEGIVYTQLVQVCTTLDQAVFALINGSVVFDFPGKGKMASYFAATEEMRSVSAPDNEPSLKGAKDSFVESLRTNTSLVRRRLRAPELKIAEIFAGRQSVTPVDILYLEGTTNPELVEETKRRIAGIDTDDLLQTASLEELIVDEVDTAFPMIAYTERPDRFCAGLVEGPGGGDCGRDSPWDTCCREPWDSFSKPGRIAPKTGSRPPFCRFSGICACWGPCSCRLSMWLR